MMTTMTTMMRRPMTSALAVAWVSVAWVSVASTAARGEPTRPQAISAPSSQAAQAPGDEPGAPRPASRPSLDPGRGKLPSSATPSTRGAGRSPSQRSPDLEIRFDALRIGADLHGPAVLEVRSLAQTDRKPLHRLHRSFVLRILENVEAPALHRR